MAMTTEDFEPNLENLDVGILDSNLDREIKIVVLGEANAGKTSMIQLFFNEENPKYYLNQEIPPTIGAEIRVFDYKNAKVGVFDLAGQELNRWLNPSSGELFYETDAVIVCFNLDHDLKKRNYEEIVDGLHKTLEINAPNAKLIILLNKYDEFVKTRKGSLQKANKIKHKIETLYNDPTYITSLISNYYPLLRMKLEHLLKALPINPPSIDFNETTMMEDLPQINGKNHIIPNMRLADVQNLAQTEYDRVISRSEIMESEFSIR